MAAYSTDSAGMHINHTLPLKLRAIAEAGFTQVELAFPDLEAYAEQEFPGYRKLDDTGKGDLKKLCETAQQIKALCDELSLGLLVVHPFSKFEGYAYVEEKAQGVQRAAAWFKVMKILNCQMLQVGSSDDPSSTGDYNEIVNDFRSLADEAAAQDPPIRIAYEMWAWGTHVNTWEHTWEICKRVNKPNFGLCLDTFQICARAYVDPAYPTAPLSTSTSTKLQESLRDLINTDFASKIFYLQISDGSNRLSPQDLEKDADAQGIDVLYAWSNAWRPLPFMDKIAEEQSKETKEYGGFLPVVDVIRAVLRTGWKGPWSYEVFYKESMAEESVDVPRRWTMAAKRSHELILEELKNKI